MLRPAAAYASRALAGVGSPASHAANWALASAKPRMAMWGSVLLLAAAQQAALGDHQLAVLGDAEVRPAVADHDVERRAGLAVRAFAVAEAEAAGAAAIGEGRGPAIVATPHQLVGLAGQGQSGHREHRAQHQVEAVRHHGNADGVAPAQVDEVRKAGIDRHGAQEVVDLLRAGAQQRHLLRGRVPRGHASGEPGFVDGPPRGVGEALEQLIGRLVGRDGAVEVDVDVDGARERRSDGQLHGATPKLGRSGGGFLTAPGVLGCSRGYIEGRARANEASPAGARICRRADARAEC